ncbi:ribulose-phosphate 3-epimerase [bacterium]|jgi:ribulose-phosphate 3-epimerase|nr:ribulose-phosphate 3-epimerase [bacterium]MBT4122144.1 ribulose-phosphate 3-epimerase [bacterium]MBT4334978.1 ribulose-phosphate 3-epimerase [bacterium]MBT4496037.1 ribulose-phosphate 3-epimerase [bacterium]MBT4764034.1 ribulose-phosphate 3-epimerase [bacterium]
MPKVVPAILSKDLDEIKKKVKLIEGTFELLQIDIMDGKFVENSTYYDISEIEKIDTNVKFELHLMVNNPDEIIDQIKGDRISRIIFHIEPVKERIEEVIHKIRELNIDVGLALNPSTALKDISEYLPKIDIVLLMTVEPGWSGQGFLESSYDRIRELREMNQEIEIEIDGGGTLENMQQLFDTGVNTIAMSSAIFKSENIEKVLEQLKKYG